MFPSFLILDIKGTESEASSRSTGCDEGVRSIALRAWTRCSGRSVNLRPSVKSQQVDVVPLPMSRFAESPSEDDAGVEIAWVVPLVELVPLGMLAWSESGIEDDAVEVNPGMFSLMRLVSPQKSQAKGKEREERKESQSREWRDRRSSSQTDRRRTARARPAQRVRHLDRQPALERDQGNLANLARGPRH